MGYDEVLPHLGGFGPYQRRIFFLVSLPAISCAFHKLAGVFLLAKPEHRCLMPFEVANASFLSDFPMNMTYPWDGINNKWSSCERLDANFTDSYFASGQPANATITCDKWVYDDRKYESSTVTEWDMVCSKSFLTATSDSLFMVGVLLGSIIFGHLSDKMGRKPIFFASLVIQVVFGVLAGIAPEYFTYTISRIVVGATTSGVFLVAYVLAMEMVGPKWRLFAGTVMMMFFSVGYMLTAAFAYFFPAWRDLQIALTLPGLLFLCYWWFIPESARWLLSKRRKAEAIATIEKAAKENKVTIPTEVLDNLIEPEKKEDADKPAPSLFDLFRYPNLRRKSLLIFFDWFVNSGTYYGLSWNTNNLGGNDLLNFVISGAVEIPAYVFLLFTLNRWGRKTILCGCMLVAGTMLLLTMAVPEAQNWLIILLAMLGKLAITASYGTIYIFSTEQFPTVIRNVGIGAASMFARFGGILAPYFNLLGDIWKPFPLIIFGAMAFAGGLLSLFLPETLGRTLPDTIADGERFGGKDDLPEGTAEEMVELNKNSTNGNVKKSSEEA
ncbi:organic cation transporter protein-like [Lutzomyia longipalpis]|nr:organic cation transporter protein-like [Lutzomyia longipalpis]